MIDDLIDPPFEYVLQEEGVIFEEEDRGELHYWCPLHEGANRPTFALWKYNGVEYVRCFSCGFGPTGLIGFLMERYDTTAAGARVLKRRYARKLPLDWVPTKLPTKRERKHLRTFEPEVEVAASGNKAAAFEFLRRRQFSDEDAAWIVEEFELGGDDKWISVPHRSPDGKFVVALKYRTLEGELRPLSNGALGFLYGSWRDSGQPTVVVAEGESDTWRLATYFRRDPAVLVVGLPHGATGPKLHWAKWLAERRTVLLFDGDDAGRKASTRWVKELDSSLVVLDPGDERDASDLTDEELQQLFT